MQHIPFWSKGDNNLTFTEAVPQFQISSSIKIQRNKCYKHWQQRLQMLRSTVWGEVLSNLIYWVSNKLFGGDT